MKQALICAGFAISLLAWSGPGELPQRQPVLVELFTSEGCSSCPPADALLERLDRTQPIPGAQVIVLSEHVDYWNHIGWADPYSSASFSSRQQQYARRFRTNGPYTPQMIVDGREEFVGSDAREAQSAIRSAARQPKTSVRLLPSAVGSVTVEVDPLPKGVHRAEVYLAYATDSADSNVLRGENKGRRLHHVSVVKELKKVGTVDDRSAFRIQVSAENGLRLIAFVQEPGNGPILGAAMRSANQ